MMYVKLTCSRRDDGLIRRPELRIEIRFDMVGREGGGWTLCTIRRWQVQRGSTRAGSDRFRTPPTLRQPRAGSHSRPGYPQLIALGLLRHPARVCRIWIASLNANAVGIIEPFFNNRCRW